MGLCISRLDTRTLLRAAFELCVVHDPPCCATTWWMLRGHVRTLSLACRSYVHWSLCNGILLRRCTSAVRLLVFAARHEVVGPFVARLRASHGASFACLALAPSRVVLGGRA
eukprot:7018056-Alexandrium_andersonii.AAC.1